MKKNCITKLLAALCLMVMVLATCGSNLAYAESYTYTIWDDAVPAPDAYEWERSVRATDLGIDAITSIADLYYRNGLVYIAMNGMVVVTNEEFETQRVITDYVVDGQTVAISAPKCIFVTKDNEIYLAEEAKGQIVHLDSEGNLVRILGDPHIKSIEGITYAPSKVIVDDVGRIYVKAKSVYEGIIELDPDGNFNRFIGANEVVPSITERFYRMIATEEQIARMELWLPTDYSDIALDGEGYILATVRDAKSTTPVRKLNAAGNDVMQEYEYIYSPRGDYSVGGMTLSTLTNIAAADDGRFAVLDSNQSRVFVYSPDGILMYVLAGSGKQTGQLNSPVDIAFMGDKILVADLVSATVEVFVPTEYGAMINTALTLQLQYDYEGAAEYWQRVYEVNPNSVIANMGLGKYQIRNDQYEEAMESYKRTGERENYSAAYERVREVWMENNLGTTIIILIVVCVAIAIIKRVIRHLSKQGVFEGKKWVAVLKKLKYTCIEWPMYMIGSPFKAFDDMKYENAGSLPFAFVIMILFAWVNLISTRYTGFLMNNTNVEKINILLVLISSICPFIVFVFANWAVGVLIDGKGNLKNIFKLTMYSLYPYVFLTLIGVFLSRICIYEETGLVNIFFAAGYVFAFFYIFIGILMVHQFSFTKGVGDVLLSFVAMVIVIFIIVLLATLVSGFVNDVGTIIDEIRMFL